MRHRGPACPPRPEIYQPLTQRSFRSMASVSARRLNRLIVPLIREDVAAVDPSLPVSHVATMEEHVERTLSRPRFMSALTTASARSPSCLRLSASTA